MTGMSSFPKVIVYLLHPLQNFVTILCMALSDTKFIDSVKNNAGAIAAIWSPIILVRIHSANDSLLLKHKLSSVWEHV